jgi:hypothetical protein
MTLLKDMSKRRAVLFPAVGEILTVNYSTGLQAVWGSKANTRLDTNIPVALLQSARRACMSVGAKSDPSTLSNISYTLSLQPP